VVDILLARSHDIRLLEFPAKRPHIIHGIHHGIKLPVAAVLIFDFRILKKRSHLPVINRHSHLIAEEPGFTDDFGVYKFGSGLRVQEGKDAAQGGQEKQFFHG